MQEPKSNVVPLRQNVTVPNVVVTLTEEGFQLPLLKSQRAILNLLASTALLFSRLLRRLIRASQQ